MLEVKIDTLSLRISLSNVEYRNILYVHYSDPDIFIVVASVHARTESCYSGCRHVTVCVVLDYHVFSLFHCNVEDNVLHFEFELFETHTWALVQCVAGD